MEADLPSARLDAAVLPRHVAIIMDGNGRWARQRGQPRVFGHRRGAEAVRRAVTAAAEIGIGYLTLFAFSSENWRRPAEEVGELMGLLRVYLRKEIAELHRNDVRLRVIGNRQKLPADVVSLIDGAEAQTKDNTGLTFTIALSYGAHEEITEAARALALEVAAGRLSADAITPEMLAGKLFTAYMPDPDLIIRTSGEQRLSNFMLWQAAYAEFLFLDIHWPDFDRSHLEHAVGEFQRRDRRYGAVAG
ncbi:MAG: isoprenyl transferase [Alphaproteobacteria bacterium]|nr:isoprenyl transferase [Alphaproteobacteria bacterium]TAD92014.1 MAG: isoprenyl transferase [Alphaproteobacteria bacterium]